MVTIIWFSRHELTTEQLNELKNSLDIHRTVWLKELASKNINNEQEAQIVFDELCAEIMWHKDDGEVVLMGVFPTPIRNLIYESKFTIKPKAKINVLEAWNINRSKEGEKPSFQHYKFQKTGELLLS